MDTRQEANLFAVASGLGSYDFTPDGAKEYVRGTESLECLQDLIRYLRLDNAEIAPVQTKLTEWNIVKSDLVPLIGSCQRGQDDKLVFTSLKMMVLLTMKPSEVLHVEVTHYLAMNIQKAKEAFVSAKMWSVLADYMGETLAESPRDRDERDIKIVELIIALIRNILQIADLPTQTTHDTIIRRLSESHILDLLLLLGNNVSHDPLAAAHSLFMLEVTYLLLQYQKPEALVEALTLDKLQIHEKARVLKAKEDAIRKKDRQTAQLASRRARMGSMYTMVTKVVKGNTNAENEIAATAGTSTIKQTGNDMVLKHTFQGGYNQLHHGTITSDSGKLVKAKSKARDYECISTQRESSLDTRKRLGNYCKEFVQNCHNALMSIIWRDIRAQRDTVLETDSFNFMWVMHFFLIFHRKSMTNADLDAKKFSVAELGVVIDTAMYKFLLEKLAEFGDKVRAHKDSRTKDLWGWRQTIAIRALHEQINYLFYMEKHGSQDLIDAARSLKQNMIYEHQLLKDCTNMMKNYNQQIHAHSFLCEVVGLAHSTVRLFESVVAEEKLVFVKRKKARSKAKASKDDTDGEVPEENEDHEANMVNEAVLDLQKEIVEFCHPKVINVYIRLLSRYKDNGVMMNHYVIKMLHRVAVECDLKGLFYRLAVLKVINIILSDTSIKKDKNFNEMRGFLKFIVSSFRTALQKNPFLCLDALFESTRRIAMFYEMDAEQINNMTREEDLAKGKWTEEEDTRLKDLFEKISKSTSLHVLDDILDALGGSRTAGVIVNRLKKLRLIETKSDLRDVDTSDSESGTGRDEDVDEEAVRVLKQKVSTTFKETAEGPERIKIVAEKCDLAEKQVKRMLRDLNVVEAKKKKARRKGRRPTHEPLDLSAIESAVRALKDMEMREVAMQWVRDELKQCADIRQSASTKDEKIFPHELLLMDEKQNECSEKEECRRLLKAVGLRTPEEAHGMWSIPVAISERELRLYADVISHLMDRPGEEISAELITRAQGFETEKNGKSRHKRENKSKMKGKRETTTKKTQKPSLVNISEDKKNDDEFKSESEQETELTSSDDDEDVFERLKRGRERTHSKIAATHSPPISEDVKTAFKGALADHREAIHWLKDELHDIQVIQSSTIKSVHPHELFPLDDFKEKALADKKFQDLLKAVGALSPNDECDFWHIVHSKESVVAFESIAKLCASSSINSGDRDEDEADSAAASLSKPKRKLTRRLQVATTESESSSSSDYTVDGDGNGDDNINHNHKNILKRPFRTVSDISDVTDNEYEGMGAKVNVGLPDTSGNPKRKLKRSHPVSNDTGRESQDMKTAYESDDYMVHSKRRTLEKVGSHGGLVSDSDTQSPPNSRADAHTNMLADMEDENDQNRAHNKRNMGDPASSVEENSSSLPDWLKNYDDSDDESMISKTSTTKYAKSADSTPKIDFDDNYNEDDTQRDSHTQARTKRKLVRRQVTEEANSSDEENIGVSHKENIQENLNKCDVSTIKKRQPTTTQYDSDSN
eukprot:CFRG0143T1